MPNLAAARRASAPALLVGLVVLATFAATALLGRPIGVPDTGAAAWLPPDGTRHRYAAGGTVLATEWAFGQAVAVLNSGPQAFTQWLEVTDVDWQSATLARFSGVFTDPDGRPGARSDTLFTVAPDGVRTAVEAPTDAVPSIFVPGRLDLPGDLRPGRAWTSEGEVAELGGETEVLSYRTSYAARATDDPALLARGCLVVTAREQRGQRPETSSERTWCRHGGLQSFTTPAGTWLPADAAGVSTVPPATGFDWATAEALEFTTRTINQIGPGAVFLNPLGAPGLLPDGTLVAANQLTPDVIGLDLGADPPAITWRGRVGGRNTAAASFGDTTLVAGTARHLVAYGPAGQWRWQRRLSDLAVAAPARIGDLAVVATLDGDVTGYELATGTERWRWRASAEVRVAPVVAADRVLVLDQAGQLACLDPSGAELWTADAGSVEHLGVWVPQGTAAGGPDEALVIAPRADSPHVAAFSLVDGRRAWRLRETLNVRDVVALDRAVVLRDDDETVALDPRSGARLWTLGGRSYAIAGGGERLLLFTGSQLEVFDDGGRSVRTWPLSLGDASESAAHVVPAEGGVVVYGPSGIAIGVPR